MIRRLMNDPESAGAYLKVLSPNTPEGTDEDLHSEKWVLWPEKNSAIGKFQSLRQIWE
jgi:hypothetical protein